MQTWPHETKALLVASFSLHALAIFHNDEICVVAPLLFCSLSFYPAKHLPLLLWEKSRWTLG